MFGIFKRTKLKSNELKLLEKVIKKLPRPYLDLINQIEDGLLKGVITNASDIPGYTAFTFNFSVLKKYDHENEKDFKLCNIEVYDRKISSYLPYEIYVSSGTLSGYSWTGNNDFDVDFDKINTANLKITFSGISDYKKIEHIFSEIEKKLLNPSEVYSVFLNKKEYFHIKDLEDGDFIGVDINRILYKITHDPMEIKVLNETIVDIFD